MKVFLISPDERKFLHAAGDRVPLGLLYISSALSLKGIDNEVFDLNHFCVEKLLEKIKNEKPDWVGLSIVSSPSFEQMKKLGEKIKEISSETKIVVGGAHATAMPESLTEIADSIVVGNGERGIFKAIEGHRGIIKEDFDINEVPLPEREKLDPSLYSMFTQDLETGKKLRTATIMTSRGCPFNCSFCSTHERKIQFREPENVRKEIRILKSQGYEALYIFDENFVIKKDFFEKITNIFKEERMKYRMEMRSSDVTEEIAKKLKETGCVYVAIGFESGDDEILKNVNKGTTIETNRRALKIFREHHLAVKGFFIIGLPGETEETARKTIEFAEEFRDKGLDFADFYALIPFPGSAIWQNPEHFKIKILSKNFSEYLQKEDPVIETEFLSSGEIKKLVDEARGRWQKKEKILITGGGGFLGKKIIEKLKEKYEIILFNRSQGKDITNPKDFEGLCVDKVIHLAALTKETNPSKIFTTNVEGTLNVLEFCRKLGKKLIFASSIAVYGDLNSPIKEDEKLSPSSMYGVTKLLGEKLCGFYHKKFGIPITMLRLSNLYGEDQPRGFLVSDIISQLDNEKIVLGNPFPKRDFIYVGDAAEAFEKSLDLEGFQTINIGIGISKSVAEVAQNIIGKKKEIEFKDNLLNESDIYADISKAKEILNWRPKYSLKEVFEEKMFKNF